MLSAKNESTLSVSYASVLMALILLGPQAAMVMAVAAAWTQCTFRVHHRYPAHCTIFSMAAEAITVLATGVAYAWLGGPPAPLSFANLSQPLVGAIAAHFLVNTGLVAGAIAISARQPLWKVWHDNFLWSGPSFMVAGVAGAAAAIVIERGAVCRGHPDAGAGLPDVSDLPRLPRASRRSEAARRGNTSAPP